MDCKYFIGLDIDSRKVQIAIIDPNLDVQLNKKINAIDLIPFIESNVLSKFQPENTLVLMESTSSSYHLFPEFVFRKFGYITKVINPTYIKRYREYKTFRGKKTDKADAVLIAEFAFKEVLPQIVYKFRKKVDTYRKG